MDIKSRMQAVLQAEAQAIAAVKVTQDFVAAVEVLIACRGKVLTTGIGKAGHIARKFAATLCSTATPADFIHPAEAAHGDIGLVGEDDVMFAFSTSGKSTEVLEILELSRHLGVAKIIGVTSHPDSSLRDYSDLVLDMGEIEEPLSSRIDPKRQHGGNARNQRRYRAGTARSQGRNPGGLRSAPPRRLPRPRRTHRQPARLIVTFWPNPAR